MSFYSKLIVVIGTSFSFACGSSSFSSFQGQNASPEKAEFNPESNPEPKISGRNSPEQTDSTEQMDSPEQIESTESNVPKGIQVRDFDFDPNLQEFEPGDSESVGAGFLPTTIDVLEPINEAVIKTSEDFPMVPLVEQIIPVDSVDQPKFEDNEETSPAPDNSMNSVGPVAPEMPMNPEVPIAPEMPMIPEMPMAPEGTLGVVDQGQNSIVGRVFEFPTLGLDPFSAYARMPEFRDEWFIGNIVLNQFDIAERSWDEGFPGLPAPKERDTLLEWFGIHYQAVLQVATSGTYEFKIHSDDGSYLFLDGQTIIEHDGLHEPTSKQASVFLESGTHNLEITYYQGPRNRIALELFWKVPGSGEFVLVPAEAMSRPQ